MANMFKVYYEKMDLKNLDLKKHIETHQNKDVTSSQGGFNFDVRRQRTIRVPDISFTPKQTDRSLNTLQNWTFQGQPFTPIFVIEVSFIESNSTLQVFDDRFRNELFALGTSVELGFLRKIDIRINGREILLGFELNVRMIEKAISQQDSDSSSSDDDTRFSYLKCTETFTNNHRFIKHFQIEHALKART
ncbi:12123_t:CDS:2 [Funneliformis caledonium]|uniref:12123_t:CDS:1 n=1 Tax=Funneliformis caledonium TaxID=1117310 RepID=A0A9N8ZYJ5_9GLOM|nr:12123_t:CDS:2 [Funneliformis caledonium]